MIHRIAVLFPAGAVARSVIDQASSIAQRANAALELVALFPLAMDDEPRDAAAASLAEMARDLSARTGLAVIGRMIKCDAESELDQEIESFATDLILAAGSADPALDFEHGPIRRLIEHSHIPVLVAEPPAAEAPQVSAPLRSMLVALNGSTTAEKILGPATELAGLFGASLWLFHADQPLPLRPGVATPAHGSYGRAADAEASSWSTWNGHQAATRTAPTGPIGPSRAILEAAAAIDADLIAMAMACAGSPCVLTARVAGEVLSMAHVPVLLLQPG
jgi:hypothetical protein